MSYSSTRMSENTPLSPPNQQVDPMAQFASNVFTLENLGKAGSAAKEKAIELKNQAQDGDHSLRILGFLGGLTMTIVSFVEVIPKIGEFNLFGAVIEIYTLALGIVAMILEGKDFVLSQAAVSKIHKYALFLKFLWGRGALYFLCGTLELNELDFWNVLSGGYMCGVGVLFLLVGRRTAIKLKSLRKSLYSEQTLHHKFSQADIDAEGGLNLRQFRTLTISLGLDMTRRETEAAFAHMHHEESGEKLTYDEFRTWWMETAVEEVIDDRAMVFV